MALVDDDDNVLAGDWFYAEAKPITVSITADNPFPVTGDTTVDGGPDTVTLTAVTDAPTGTTFTYQWQQKSGTSWSDISSATASMYKMADQTSSTTKTIRVKATASGTTYTSGEVSITWNLGQTLREITDALAANFDRPSAPTGGSESGSAPRVPILPPHQTALLSAESALLTCARIIDGSFASLMTQYTGDTKTLLDSGNCRTQANTMWMALETSFTTTLTNIRTTGTNATAINAFLASEPGQSFVTYMTDSSQLKDSIKSFIVPAAGILANEPEPPASEPDDQGNPVGGSGQDRNTRQGEDTEGQYSGLGCIPAQGTPDATNSASLATRLRVLNCLLFATPWQFWLDLAGEDPDINGNTPPTDYELAVDRLSWLGYGDLKCTIGNQVREGLREEVTGWLSATLLRAGTDLGDSHWEKAACLKHDLAFESLRRFAGSTKPMESKFERDEAWNPRNKVLADFLFYVDLYCENTEDESAQDRRNCLTNPKRFTDFLSGVRFLFDSSWRRSWAVSRANTSGWPVSREMLTDASSHRLYRECQTYKPELTTLAFSKQGRSINIDYTVDACVQSDYKLEICFKAPDEFCKEAISGEAFLTFVLEDFIPETLHITKIIFKPVNNIYGPDGTETVIGRDYEIHK